MSIKGTLYRKFKTDPEAEREGQWVTIDTTEDGRPIRFRIRSADSDKVRKVANDLAKKNRGKFIAAGSQLTPELEDSTTIEILVQGIVVTWENVDAEDGSLLPYSKENARKLFTDLRELRKELNVLAATAETFRARELVEEMAGNSSAPSAPVSAPEGEARP